MIRPLFVVGTGRSGTTLLRALLNAHPDLHLSKESSFMVATRKQRFERNPHAELERYFRSAPFGWLQLPAQTIRDKLPTSPSRADAFRAILRADAARFGKTAWGDKTPAHWLAVDDILHAFPNAVIVHLVRDPRKVVASLLRMPWGSPSVLANTLYGEFTVRTLLKKEHVHHVRFEDLLDNPRDILQQILTWTGLPWSDQVLQHREHAPNDVGGIPWLTGAYESLKPHRESRPLPPTIEAWVERLCRSSMGAFGYTPYHEPLSIGPMLRDLPQFVASAIHMTRLQLFPPSDRDKELRSWLEHNPHAFRHWPDWDIESVIAASFGNENDSE